MRHNNFILDNINVNPFYLTSDILWKIINIMEEKYLIHNLYTKDVIHLPGKNSNDNIEW